jgi:outer membrane protein assembly factor BamB
MSTTSAFTETTSPESAVQPPRRWPALLILAIALLLHQCYHIFDWFPDRAPAMPIFMTHFQGPLLMVLVLAIWWLFWGPARLRTRLAALGLAILVAASAIMTAEPSIRMFLITKGIPATVALVTLFLCAFWWLRPGLLFGGGLALAILTLLPWDLLRATQGVTGQFQLDAEWRWTPTAEALASAYDQGKKATDAAGNIPAVSAADWPGFRGPERDGVVRVAVDLKDFATPPKELWRRPVGPGWSSLCVVGDLLWTQEQRGEEELVTCYRASTGDLLWTHADPVRFYEGTSGLGPRATPTFHDGRIYSFGGTGILNCLDAASGKLLWKVDVQGLNNNTGPHFGHATSPLVIDGRVVVQAGAPEGSRVRAYDAVTGKELWKAGTSNTSYCSPQLSTIAGTPQLLIFNIDGLFAHDPATGKELWSYPWSVDQTAGTVIQPMILPGDRIVLGGGRIGIGTRCIQPSRKGDAWSVEELWQTRFSPGFNDIIRFDDHLYGLEGGRMVCLEAGTGSQKWKDGRYGTGQLLRVGEQLLVLADSGKLAIVSPSPAAWQEVAQAPALTDKTWNHPVIANGRLYVRNGREMACFELR